MTKWIVRVLLALVLLLLLGVVALLGVFDANRLKQPLQDWVAGNTNAKLEIDGELAWRLWPRLAVVVEGVSLSLDASGEPSLIAIDSLAATDSLAISVDLSALLNGQLNVEAFELHGLRLQHVAAVDGSSNWSQFEIDRESGVVDSPVKEVELSSNEALGFPAVQLGRLLVSGSEIFLRDERKATTQCLQLRNLEAENVVVDGRPFPFVLDMSLQAVADKKLDLALQSTLSLYAAERKLVMEDLELQMADSMTRGRVELVLSDSLAPSVELQLQTDQLNVSELQSTVIGEPAQADGETGAASAGSSAIAEQGADVLPWEMLDAMSASIDWRVNVLHYENWLLEQLSVEAVLSSGVLRLQQLSARLYEGDLSLSATIDSTAKPASVVVQEKLQGVRIKPLLVAAGSEPIADGVLDIEADLHVSGRSTADWRRSLGGSTRFVVAEGEYFDSNVEHTLCQVIARVRNEPMVAEWPPTTHLDQFAGEIQWQAGRGSVNSLQGGLDIFALTGVGGISLLEATMDLDFDANLHGDVTGFEPGCAINRRYRDIAWPLECGGSLSEVECGVDNDRLRDRLQQAAKKDLLRKAEKKVEEKLKDKLGDEVKGLLEEIFR